MLTHRSVLLLALGTAFSASATAADTETASEISDLCALPVPAQDALVHVPFETVDGRIYVNAEVNGKGPFRFAVDTGASGLARADASLLETLSLTAHGQSSTSDGVSTADVETVHLASIRLGGLVRNELDVITRDYASRSAPDARFSGILARGYFEDGLLVIDYRHRTLTFSRSMELRRDSPGVLVYERAFRVPVSIGALKTTGQLDTGANVSLVLPQPLYQAVDGTNQEPAGQATLTNGRHALDRATVRGPVQIGALTLSNIDARISETYPELLIGAHALQNTVLFIDQRAKAIAICP